MNDDQNTSKNNHSFEVPKSIIKTGQLLQLVSKTLAAQFAARIFSTPQKFKPPERELMMRESAKCKLVKINAIDKKVMVYTYGYSKKKVLLVHGWSGRGTQMFHLADKILENKMMVVSFDGPAHGLSKGSKTNLFEFLTTIEQINKEFGPFDSAIGHSFGGMSLLNAISQGLEVNKLVTIGTDNSLTEVIKIFIEKLKLKPKTADTLLVHYQKVYKQHIDSYNSESAAKQINTPTLVLHDSIDKIVPVSSAIAIRQSLKNGELLISHGLGHHEIFKDKIIIQRIIDFLQ